MTETSAYPNLGVKDYALVGGVAASLYMINGAHSQSMCNMLTGLLPAVFTYRMILEPVSTLSGYQAILFYWALYGGLTAADSLCSDSVGYFLGKFVVLAAVFGHAVYQNETLFDSLFRPKTHNMTITSVYAETTECTQQASSRWAELRTNAQEPANVAVTAHSMTATALSHQVSPTPTAFSDSINGGDGMTKTEEQITVVPYWDSKMTEGAFIEANHGDNQLGTPYPGDANKQKLGEVYEEMRQKTPVNVPFKLTEKYLVSANAYCDSMVEGDSVDQRETIDEPDTAHIDIQTLRETMQTTQGGDLTANVTRSCMTNTNQTVPLAFGDIITSPMHEIHFKTRVPGEMVDVTLTNITEENIMWALKTNAMSRISSWPVSGNIRPGQAEKISLVITKNAVFDDEKGGDKIAIDYIPTHDDGGFQKSFFALADHTKRRHRLTVAYAK